MTATRWGRRFKHIIANPNQNLTRQINLVPTFHAESWGLESMNDNFAQLDIISCQNWDVNTVGASEFLTNFGKEQV